MIGITSNRVLKKCYIKALECHTLNCTENHIFKQQGPGHIDF